MDESNTSDHLRQLVSLLTTRLPSQLPSSAALTISPIRDGIMHSVVLGFQPDKVCGETRVAREGGPGLFFLDHLQGRVLHDIS